MTEKFDVTKSEFALLRKTKEHVKEVPNIKFCYADVNCGLTVKISDESQRDLFSSSFDFL